MLFRIVPTLLILCLASPALLFAQTFQLWSEKVFVRIGRGNGQQAEKRMRYLHDLVAKNQNRSVEEKLRLAYVKVKQTG